MNLLEELELNIFEDALYAALLFHSGTTWTAAHRAEWQRITGTDEATPEALCDHIRKVLTYFDKHP